MKSILEGIHPVLASNDMAASVSFYQALGFTLVFQDAPDATRYAVVSREGFALHIQWADAGQWAYPVDRQACRFLVNDVDAIYREFSEKNRINAETGQGSPWAAPADTTWGTREFHLRDPGQNILQFYHPR